MPAIDLPPSASASLWSIWADSLKANRLAPQLLYLTPRQADLWRQVSAQHSPIHTNPEFGRIYREAFSQAADRIPVGDVWLVGLGAGTGLKETEFFDYLKATGHNVRFSAIDVSRDLVTEAAEKLAIAGATPARNLVCDLAEIDFLPEWIERNSAESPRVFTFFGLVPNLRPALVARLFRALLRPGDFLLVSAHLAPVGEGTDVAAAMKKVRPQYDNPETLAWLRAALEESHLIDRLKEPLITISEIEGIPAFVGLAQWRDEEPFEAFGDVFDVKIDRPLEIFRSLRYTPNLFENFLRREGFAFEMLAITACREEAIWAITRK